MEIRYATNADTIHIIRAIQNKKMDYNTTNDVKEDISNNRLLIATENGKVLASMAIVYKPHRGYHALMRMCVYSKKSKGKGIAGKLVDYALSLNLGVYGGTPWADNPAMCHILEKRGFKYQYTFKENYKFYKTIA